VISLSNASYELEIELKKFHLKVHKWWHFKSSNMEYSNYWAKCPFQRCKIVYLQTH